MRSHTIGDVSIPTRSREEGDRRRPRAADENDNLQYFRKLVYTLTEIEAYDLAARGDNSRGLKKLSRVTLIHVPVDSGHSTRVCIAD